MALLLLLAALALGSLSACGGSSAASGTATPVAPVATATLASGSDALLAQYQQLLTGQKWDDATALFGSSIDAATKTQVVADLTDFVAKRRRADAGGGSGCYGQWRYSYRYCYHSQHRRAN